MAARRRGSPASNCGMNSSLEPAGSRTGISHSGVHGRRCPSQGSPRAQAGVADSTDTFCIPAAAPPLMSPWRYPQSGAKLTSSMQKMRSCLPSLRTWLMKSCSCQKPVFSEHFRGESEFLLLIPGPGSDLLGVLLPVTEHLHDSVSLLNRSMNLLALAAERLNDSI